MFFKGGQSSAIKTDSNNNNSLSSEQQHHHHHHLGHNNRYERFQLYDPDDSEDMEDDTIDPDVRQLLVGRRGSGGGSVATNTDGGRGHSQTETGPEGERGSRKCFKTGLYAISMMAFLVLVMVAMYGRWWWVSTASPNWNLSGDPECDGDKANYPDTWGKKGPPSSLSYSQGQKSGYPEASVTTDNEICSHIGTKILLRNGTAVDAAVAVIICNGALGIQRVGMGSGFAMLMYNKAKRSMNTLIAKETAGVSGDIWGYHEAKEKFGNPQVSWESLFQPTIDICREGIAVSTSLAKALTESEPSIMADPVMRDTFVDPATNKTWEAGKLYTRKALATTLERIAKNGPEEYYGDLKRPPKKPGDLSLAGMSKEGILPLHSYLGDYKKTVKWGEALKSNILTNRTLYTVSDASIGEGGAVLKFMLDILEEFNTTKEQDHEGLLLHREAEGAKWAFGAGYGWWSRLGDVRMVKEAVRMINDSHAVKDLQSLIGGHIEPDHTAITSSTTCVMAPNGDAVAVTATSRNWSGFPNVIMSNNTGLVMVTGTMDEGQQTFPSPPVMVLNDRTGYIVLAAGTSGSRRNGPGFRDITALFQVVVRNVWMGQNIKVAVDWPRVHQQLVPITLYVEEGFQKTIVDELSKRGHFICLQRSASFPVVNAIARIENDSFEVAQDFRYGYV